MKPDKLVRRRTFLKGAAVGLAAASIPTIIPSNALGKDGSAAPSDRIVLGGIGVGRRGRYVLGRMLAEKGVQFVTACDVQASRRQYVKDMVDGKYRNKDCVMYRDMFELLGRKDIDAVLITTGDNWHALASILAAKAGKDVYCEKPCGMMFGDCQDLADTMNRYSRVFQAGTQRRSIGNFQFAVHLARSGKLGKLHTLHASINRLSVSHAWLPAQPEPDKDVCDWDRWLGPAPWRPYNARYVQGGWHGYVDLNAGARLLDWGSHTVDLCQWANDADDTAPITYEPHGGTINAKYANGVKLVIRPDKWLGLGTCPVRFEGDEGWVETGDTGAIKLHPASLMGERKRYLRRGTDPASHASDFFDCIRSRGLTAANADVMRHAHVACHAAAISWRLGRKLTFDPAKEVFINDKEANRMRTRAKRAPWHA
ncbi:MAG: Gfo/Idh/MocA family oxidoreductase [Phycisphaerae bacterium]|nr:Gfo/Idh/MocA family oxidoreductase [Planctomycetota bacterium]MBL7218703.1 Gfo/Idh/MocA family oxidoreductase [Phycisphaerae bacterium]